MSATLKWEDPPSTAKGSKYDDVFGLVKGNPGKWAMIEEASKNPYSLAAYLKSRYVGFSIKTRNTKIYAMFGAEKTAPVANGVEINHAPYPETLTGTSSKAKGKAKAKGAKPKAKAKSKSPI